MPTKPKPRTKRAPVVAPLKKTGKMSMALRFADGRTQKSMIPKADDDLIYAVDMLTSWWGDEPNPRAVPRVHTYFAAIKAFAKATVEYRAATNIDYAKGKKAIRE